MRYFFYTVLALLIGLSGYLIGVRLTEKKLEQTVINNYGYVKEIAQLASLEVNGITNIHRSNVANDDASITGILKKKFLESTVDLSIPYTAKYGIDMKDSAFRMVRQDSVIAIYLPSPQLLSFELRLDGLLAQNKKGWLVSSDEGIYTRAQEKLYKEARSQLASNPSYLQQSQEKITALLQSYFRSVGMNVICYYDAATLDLKKN